LEDNEVFVSSPNECLRGFSSVELMEIADDGEVFQHFVKSLSGSDQSPGSMMVQPSNSGGAIPKKGKLTIQFKMSSNLS